MQYPFIVAAEEKYKASLTEKCRRLFIVSPMPSHDHNHHARVWDYSSLILRKLYDAGMVTDTLLADKAIIASYFHDTGLTLNHGEDHGIQSRLICSEFLSDKDIPDSDKKDILDAVERHDDKVYAAASDPASLSAIISVADDMDAFGCTGISRYAEIYSMRGIPANEMASRIIANVESRCRHLAETYSIFPDLVEEQQGKAGIVITYYKNFIP